MEMWVHLSIGSLTVETGTDMPHYSTDLIDDMWKQVRASFIEVVDAAAERGLIVITDDEPPEAE